MSEFFFSLKIALKEIMPWESVSLDTNKNAFGRRPTARFGIEIHTFTI